MSVYYEIIIRIRNYVLLLDFYMILSFRYIFVRISDNILLSILQKKKTLKPFAMANEKLFFLIRELYVGTYLNTLYN